MTTVAAAHEQEVHSAVRLPEVDDPGAVAPKDARELSKLFFGQLAVLEEGTPPSTSTRATR